MLSPVLLLVRSLAEFNNQADASSILTPEQLQHSRHATERKQRMTVTLQDITFGLLAACVPVQTRSHLFDRACIAKSTYYLHVGGESVQTRPSLFNKVTMTQSTYSWIVYTFCPFHNKVTIAQ